jgi:hypothetical protein
VEGKRKNNFRLRSKKVGQRYFHVKYPLYVSGETMTSTFFIHAPDIEKGKFSKKMTRHPIYCQRGLTSESNFGNYHFA